MVEEETAQWPETQRTTTGSSTIRPIPQQQYHPRFASQPVKETQSTARDPAPATVVASGQTPRSMRPTATPGLDDTPYIHFAIEQLTRDEEALGERRDGAMSPSDYSDEPRVSPISPAAITRDKRSSDTIILRPDTPPQSPLRKKQYIPTEPTVDTYSYPKLNFVPRSLQWLSLAGLILGCFTMVALLITSNVLSIRRNGLWEYDGVSTSRYFLFQYFPTLLATLLIVWLLIVQSALYRIFAFDTLASDRKPSNSRILQQAALFSTNYLIPDVRFFGFQEPMLGVCSIIFWLALFTIPLQSCLFQTRFFLNTDGVDVWRWTACQPVGWTLLVLYILLICALLYLLVRYARRTTGIKWESSSLADILLLLAHSNVLSDFENITDPSSGRLTRLPTRKYRLGYWRTTDRSSDVLHTLGRSGSPPPPTQTSYSEKGKAPINTSDVETLASHNSRYSHVPWFLRDSSIAAFISIAFVLTTALLIVSFVHHPLTHGYLPLLPAPTTSAGFSPADFLYSFLPSLLGLVLYLVWQPIDNAFRSLQPYAAMNTAAGGLAEDCLLLEYLRYPPLEVSLRAAAAGDFRVAYISFISVLALTFPTLAGGVFTAQYFQSTGDVRIAAAMAGYIPLLVFVIIYAISYLAIFPGRKRYLPHSVNTLGGVIAILASGTVLGDDLWKGPVRGKIELVTKVVSARRGDGERARWRIGEIKGRGGAVGVERVGKGRMGTMF